MSWLQTQFQLSENQTNVRREIVGGCTTFLTMSYIIFVNPVILSSTGMDSGAVMVATCLSSALATLLMAFLANYPVALAPAMGHNVFFAFAVCTGMGIPWQTALGAVFISGCIFILLSTVGFRKIVMDSIPNSLKFSIAVGIGLMISLLGFQWAGIVVDNNATLIGVGTLTKPYVLVSGAGLVVSMICLSYGIRGSILFGMATAAVMAWMYGLIDYTGLVSSPPSIAPTFLAMAPLKALSVQFAAVIFVFFILDLFDTVGTLVGVAEQANMMEGGELPRAKQALLSDALGTVAGAVLGTSTVTSYVESCSGIGDGARTGLASVVTGLLFLLALFFYPVVQMLGQGLPVEGGGLVYPVIAPALIMVGYMMMKGVRHIAWDDITESIPAFLTIMLIGFSFSITEGIAFGFMSYTVLKLATFKFRDVHPVLIVISIIFAIRYFYLGI